LTPTTSFDLPTRLLIDGSRAACDDRGEPLKRAVDHR